MARYPTVMVDADHPVTALGGVVRRSPNSTRVRVYEHRLVLFERIGLGPHVCNWCGIAITWDGTTGKRLVCDHIDGDIRNNAVANLVAACDGCNTMRARRYRPSIEDGDLSITLKDGTRTRAFWAHCEVCGASFKAAVARRNTARTCSKACAGIKGSRARWSPTPP